MNSRLMRTLASAGCAGCTLALTAGGGAITAPGLRTMTIAASGPCAPGSPVTVAWVLDDADITLVRAVALSDLYVSCTPKKIRVVLRDERGHTLVETVRRGGNPATSTTVELDHAVAASEVVQIELTLAGAG